MIRADLRLSSVLCLYALLPTSTVNAAPSTTENRELALAVGEHSTLSARGVKSYSEGTPGIVEVRLTPGGGEFVVVGQRPGETTLLLIRRGGKQILYSIAVFPRPMSAVEDELSRLLKDDTGIRIRRVGPRMFIEGGVNSEAEVKRIGKIASLYPKQVESLVVLGGTAAERKHNVRMDVFFVRLDRLRDFSVGISWPGGIVTPTITAQFDLLNPGFTNATAQIANQPLLGLDLAQANGWAKVYRHSTVITSNGGEATFSAGSEQNYRITGGLAADLAKINFGTEVTVLPRFDPATKELHIQVQADVSDITAPLAIGADIPGRATTTLKTQVTLKLGQALILSGIHSRSNRGGNAGLPGLSQIPIFGVLFGSQTRSQNMQDGALFVVPSIIDAAPGTSRKLVDELIEVYDDFDGGHDVVPLPRLDPKDREG